MSDTLVVPTPTVLPDGQPNGASAAAVPVTPAAPTSTPPEIPAKFKNPDGSVNAQALLQSYQELERKQSSSSTSSDQTTATPTDQTTSTPAQVTEAPSDTTADPMAKYYEEFEADGKLSEKSYEELAARGIPKAIIDSYAERTIALLNQETDKLLTEVGGQDAFNTAVAWAQKNMTPAKVIELDKKVNSYNSEARASAVKELMAEYTKANGTITTRVVGASDTGVASIHPPYESDAQMRADMRDPRYAKDPAFREMVLKRTAAMAGLQVPGGQRY